MKLRSRSKPVPPVVTLSSDTDFETEVVGNDGGDRTRTVVFEKSQTSDDKGEGDTRTFTTVSNNVPLPTAGSTCNLAASEKMPSRTTRSKIRVKNVQLPTSITPSSTKSGEAEFVTISDSDSIIAEFIGDIVPPKLTNINFEKNVRDQQRNPVHCVDRTVGASKDPDPSPKPSTSKSCISGNKRKAKKSSNNLNNQSSPAKKVRFSMDIMTVDKDTVGSEKQHESEDKEPESDSDDNVSRNFKRSKLSVQNKNRLTIISSESDDDESSSSLFEPIVVHKKKVNLSSSSGTKSKSSNEKVRKRRPRYRVKTKRSKGKQPQPRVHSDSDTSSVDEENNKRGSSSSTESDDEKTKSRNEVRRSRRKASKIRTKNTEKENAFELLRQRREKMASKPKRASPVRTSKGQGSDDGDEDSDSSYTSGPSPCPIVDNSTPEGSDFDGSTPSSSSVTSSGVTDEEPDLGSGSDGEKLLKAETKDSDKIANSDDDDDSVKSQTSSSDGELPDDGRNDQRCVLCKNLGSANIEGRREIAMSGSFSWCKCGECRVVSSNVRDYDLVCCREIKTILDFLDEELEESGVCITNHPRFEQDVLNYEGYARSVSKHCEPRRYQTSYYGMFHENFVCGKADYKTAEMLKQRFKSSSSFEKMKKSLQSFLRWIFDALESDRMVIPACVQYKVRQEFDISDFEFRTFHPSPVCPIGSHCRLASTV